MRSCVLRAACSVCILLCAELQVKVIPMVVARFIDMHVSLGRLSRFMDLPEVAPAPPEPPRPPSNVLWRNVG